MYYHTDELNMLRWLADVFTTAAIYERRVRLDVDEKGRLKVKVGEGGWTPPLAGTPDPYRDNRPAWSNDDCGGCFNDECCGACDCCPVGA